MRYFIKLAYKGTQYHGWQIQPNAITIQELISNALSKILNISELNLIGAGRTDTGVHARNFYAHFDIDFQIDNLDLLVYKLNRFLPKDIAIFGIFQVSHSAHARFDALSRTYKYYISAKKSPFLIDSSWYITGKLNIELMNKAAKYIIGKHDFTSFSKLHSQTNTNICNVMNAKWTQNEDILVFEVTADRFLRNMVRALVGTLVDVGRGKIDSEEVLKIMDAKDRREAGESVPAHGLFLEEIEYDFDKLLFN